MRRFPVLLLSAGLLVGLAACGGSSSDSAGKSSESSGGDSEYSKLVEKGNNAKIKVTYKTADGGSWTIAQDPPKSSYVVDDTAVYSDGTSNVVCTSLKNNPQCIKTEGSGDSANLASLGLVSQFKSLLDTKNLPGTTRITERQIAGRSAQCASYQPPFLKDTSVETCVDKDTGIALLVKSTAAGTSVLDLEATAVSEPKASDFTPPAAPQDLNSLLTTTTTM